MKNIKLKISKYDVPILSRVLNYGINSSSKLLYNIDKINKKNIEWAKIDLLKKDVQYLAFINSLTNCSYNQYIKYLDDYKNDKKFKKNFSEKLGKLDNIKNERHDDLRFHAITLYLVVRHIKPNLFIETGVASGKSSALVLLALHHNKKGKLISIDLPNIIGSKMADGSSTYIGNNETGWLIPNYLKKKWQLIIGDSKKNLKIILKDKNNIPDIFLHDSLHTENHTTTELNMIYKSMKKGLILCDNIEMGSGISFEKILKKNKKIGYCYKNFAGFIKDKK
tara:strand:+ start:10821 stop:11660 length:840 start_codon:yes stop_codon:yes gene_type:complete